MVLTGHYSDRVKNLREKNKPQKSLRTFLLLFLVDFLKAKAFQ